MREEEIEIVKQKINKIEKDAGGEKEKRLNEKIFEEEKVLIENEANRDKCLKEKR